MKVKVLKEFVDKDTRQFRAIGTTFDCSENRFKEIQRAGDFLSLVPVEKKKEVKASK